jgi:crossover junction endodeoxyribonuclease RuvC
LLLIFKKMESLIRVHQPAAVAIEAPFFGKNVQSMLKLGRAQGVAIAAAMMHGLEATEYAPRKVKQAVTGRGNATKEQVWEIIKHTLNLHEDDFKFYDATDAVAVAICHHYQQKVPVGPVEPGTPPKKSGTTSKKTDWASFIKDNPDRVKFK